MNAWEDQYTLDLVFVGFLLIMGALCSCCRPSSSSSSFSLTSPLLHSQHKSQLESSSFSSSSFTHVTLNQTLPLSSPSFVFLVTSPLLPASSSSRICLGPWICSVHSCFFDPVTDQFVLRLFLQRYDKESTSSGPDLSSTNALPLRDPSTHFRVCLFLDRTYGWGTVYSLSAQTEEYVSLWNVEWEKQSGKNNINIQGFRLVLLSRPASS